MEKPILELSGISKEFPGVKALKDVNFELRAGEVHVVMGENGAGKSTLMKIINGIYAPDTGSIKVHGTETKIRTPREALEHRISMIHQELNPVKDMTVAENLYLGREPGKSIFVNRKELNRKSVEVLSLLNIDIHPDKRMGDLTISEIQMVEIAKAISYNAEIIIMDEPTSAITEHEVDSLFECIQDLKAKNVSFIYISHKMNEIFRIADRITVLRDGETIDTRPAREYTRETLITQMVGRTLDQIFPNRSNTPGNVVLEVENLGVQNQFKGISFQLRCGEILGVAGLMGAGRSEMAETIFGIRKATEGSIHIRGCCQSIRCPSDAIGHGIAMVTEDRKASGLNHKASVKKDMTIVNLSDFCKLRTFIDTATENKACDENISTLKIRTPHRNQVIHFLSGGNQQKVILARWLLSNPDIFILDEPTRGIDVGAKFEIYSIISDLAGRGKAVLLISSELPEIVGMCDRVLVMHEGRIAGELEGKAINQEAIMQLATGHKGDLS